MMYYSSLFGGNGEDMKGEDNMLKKRITAFVAVLCMLLFMAPTMPTAVFADGTDYAGLSKRIGEKAFAYAVDAQSQETAENQLKTQFDIQFSDIVEHEFKNTFTDTNGNNIIDSADVTSATTVTNNNSKLLNVTKDDGSTVDLDCYKVEVQLNNNAITAVGYIYKMEKAEQILIKATKNGTPKYYLKTLGGRNNSNNPATYPDVTCTTIDYDKYDQNTKDIDIGGTKVCNITGSTDYCVSLQVIRADDSQFNLFVYKPDFEGAMATCSGTTLRADKWDFGNTPFMAFTNTTSSDPFVLETFFGYSSIKIDPQLANTVITGISSNLPDGAVTITGTDTVTFNSGYYDSVPLTITYTENGQQKTGYVVIKRVGIDIQEYSNGQTNTNHGTQPGIPITWGNDDCVIYATYYWPAAKSQNDNIDLYCTMTYANGSVETKVLETSTLTAAKDGFTDKDDFLVYKGSKANKPVKVSIIAVNAGAFGATEFGGATLGSGAGVTWTAQ